MRQLATIVLFFCFSMAFSQQGAIDQANVLIKKNKYLAAYNALNTADPTNNNPQIAIAKTDLVLKHYSYTENHHVFGLKDFALGEDTLAVQNDEVGLTIIKFAPDSVLNMLIVKFPEDYKIKKALGDYYFSIHQNYEDAWLLEDAEVIEEFKNNYMQAYEKGVSDFLSLYGLGYASMIEEDFDAAISFFEKSVKLNDKYVLNYTNLSEAYFNIGKFDKALQNAQQAFNLYEEPEEKSGAARKIAEIYIEMKQKEKAVTYYQKADEIQPNDYLTLMPLLKLEVETNNDDYKNRTNQIFTLAPDNPVVYQEIYKIYSENEKENEFVDYMETQKAFYRSNVRVLAHIYFYSAIAQYEQDEWVSAKINFEKARNLFSNVFKSDHIIFKVIDSYTNAIKKK